MGAGRLVGAHPSKEAITLVTLNRDRKLWGLYFWWGRQAIRVTHDATVTCWGFFAVVGPLEIRWMGQPGVHGVEAP